MEEKVLAVAEKNEFIQSLRLNDDFQAIITFLSKEKIVELKQESMIYQRLPEKDLYQVNYVSPTLGNYLAVVDLEDENVLMFYRLAGVTIE